MDIRKPIKVDVKDLPDDDYSATNRHREWPILALDAALDPYAPRYAARFDDSTHWKIKMLKAWSAVLTLSLVSACATSPKAPDAARSELAPTGKLRAGMNLGNALFTTKYAATGELRGVSVDVMRELASRLGVSVDFVVHATPGDVADASAAGTWDVAVLAIEQARAEKIAFSPAMTEIEATYVVQKNSPLRRRAKIT